MSNIKRQNISVDVLFNGESYACILECEGEWQRGYPETRTCPAEPEGWVVETVRLKPNYTLTSDINAHLREHDCGTGAWDVDVEVVIDRNVVDTTLGGLLTQLYVEIDWAQIETEQLRDAAALVLDQLGEANDL